MSDRKEVDKFLKEFHRHFEITDEEQRALIHELANTLFNEAYKEGFKSRSC